MTAKDVLSALWGLGVIRFTNIQPLLKPACSCFCTCQECGRPHDKCICKNNEIIIAIEKLEQKSKQDCLECLETVLNV